MSQPVLYCAITAHGFGHAVRVASVAAKIQQQAPNILLVMVTTAPRWLLASYIPGDFIYRPRAFDVGVIQSDSITMDKAATLQKMQEFQTKQNSIIAAEVNFIQTNKVGLILADIPALAAPIAKIANIPCWMMSNFGWDFIYRSWGGEFVKIADWISECYSKCDGLFRLPFAEPMSAFSNIIDVGLTGGTPYYSEAILRANFNINTPVSQTILLSFGGLGLQAIPYQNLAKFPHLQFITFDHQAPHLPNLIKVTDNKYRPVDFLPLCGRIISKPGYSTFAEAIRLNVPIISLTREDFAESSLLLNGLQNHSYHQIISAEDFFQGNWDFLHQLPNPPQISTPIPINGTEVIANQIIEYFNTKL